MLGAYCWGIFSDNYGRRRGYLATCLFTCCFGVCSAFSKEVQTLTVMRFFVGVGLGNAN